MTYFELMSTIFTDFEIRHRRQAGSKMWSVRRMTKNARKFCPRYAEVCFNLSTKVYFFDRITANFDESKWMPSTARRACRADSEITRC